MANHSRINATTPGSSSAGGTRLFFVLLAVVVALILIVAYFANRDKKSESGGSQTPLAGATTTSPVLTSATGTASLNWGQLFFTRPIYPDKPANRGVSDLNNQFVAMLNSAQSTIDLAIYEFDLPAATDALVGAQKRGVKVRMVTDTDSVTSTDAGMKMAYAALKAGGIPIVQDKRSAIMHDKFAVVDNHLFWGGSWNFTIGDTYQLNNNGIMIDSPELAANYENEFKLMFEQHKFGPSKKQGALNPILNIGGVRVQNYFSPQDGIESRLVTLVNSAQSSVYFLAFQFTLDDVGQAMIARSKAGVTVSGVFENTGSETSFSEYGKLKAAGLAVYQDGNPYIMHEKVIIIDEKTVAFGSYNFSAAAENSNDENILIVDDPALAARFIQEFNYVRGVALNPIH